MIKRTMLARFQVLTLTPDDTIYGGQHTSGENPARQVMIKTTPTYSVFVALKELP